MVESKLVELVVAGSSPVGHPILSLSSDGVNFNETTERGLALRDAPVRALR